MLGGGREEEGEERHQIRYENEPELLVVHSCIQKLQSSLLISKS